MLKTKQALSRQPRTNVVPFTLSTRARSGPAAAFGMHDEEVVCGKLLAFPGGRHHRRRPMTVRNPSALKPLLGPLGRDSNIGGHLRNGVPEVEKIVEGEFHDPVYTRDRLSLQGGAIVPVTESGPPRTITGMGRAKSPVQFNKELAKRLSAARIAAGYKNQSMFAKELGVELERYKKWESGRTPIQHEYIPRACMLLGKDANYLFDIDARESIAAQVATRRTG